MWIAWYFLILIYVAVCEVELGRPSLSTSCYTASGHTFCYDSSGPDAAFHAAYKSYDALEKEILEKTVASSEELFKVNVACQQALKNTHTLRLTDGSSVPIVLLLPMYCEGFGNQIGFLFELISFALSNNIAVGRISGHSKWTSNQCSDARNAAKLFAHMPKFVLPASVVTKIDPAICKSVAEWPWESTNPYFFRQMPILAKVNNHMVTSFMMHQNIKQHRRDSSSKIFNHAFTIHFRCSDNLAHQYMGLLPFSDYNKTLQSISEHPSFHAPLGIHASTGGIDQNIIRSIIIYTDARLYASHGEICVRALAEFEALLASIPRLKHLDIVIHRTTTIQTYALMHLSRFLFCSASTLCFFSAFGHEHAYIPTGKGVVISLPSYPFQSNMTFINTRMVRPAKETMSADDFAKFFLQT